MPTTIGIADYQKLFLHTLAALIDQFPGYLVTVTATSVTGLLEQLSREQTHPDVLLIDVRLPGIGDSLAPFIAKAYPSLRTLALTETDDDTAIIALLKAGWRGFVLKENLTDTLEDALATLAGTGYYNGDMLHTGVARSASADDDTGPDEALTEAEHLFLNLICSDRSYKDIAVEMGLSERIVEGFRNALFSRLQVHSRAGLALEAIRRQLITT